MRSLRQRLGASCVLITVVGGAVVAPAAGRQSGSDTTALPAITFTIAYPAGSIVTVAFTGGLTKIVQQVAAGQNMLSFTATSTGFKVVSGGTQAGESAAETVIVEGQWTPGTPIAGTASLPLGATLSARIGSGPAQTIKNGLFSLTTPTNLGAATGPRLEASPGRLRGGRRVRVFGNVAGGCVRGDSVALLSRAFTRTYSFAGLPAVYATVGRGGGFSVRTRIPANRKSGRYKITGRCGGGDLGVIAYLRVLGS